MSLGGQTPFHSAAVEAEDLSPLWLGHYSLRHIGLGERWQVAAAAGFTGISVAWTELLEMRAAGVTATKLKDRASSLGLQLTQLEYFPLATPHSPGVAQELATDMAQTAAELGCTCVTTVGNAAEGFVDPLPDDVPIGNQIIDNFGVLCDACDTVGIGCGVEFMPFVTAIDTLSRAVELLRAVDRPNAGLIIDALHFFRSGPDWSGLRDVAPGDIHTVQLCDGLAQSRPGPYIMESLFGRTCPGEGEFDLYRFISTLRAFDAPFTVEVLSDELNNLPALDSSRRMADSTRAFLAAAANL